MYENNTFNIHPYCQLVRSSVSSNSVLEIEEKKRTRQRV